MKVKGKTELEGFADRLYADCEGLKPCELAYVLSELTKRLSLEMLRKDNERS